MKKIYINSFDNTKLCCYLWDDVTNPKGVVQISHGMTEHVFRYDRFAKFLNENGYIAFGDDHRGHGLTESDKDRGWHKGNMFADTCKDLVFISDYLKEKYNLPLLFFGHSYGSFLGQSFLQQNTKVSAVALVGTAYMPRLLVMAGIVFTFPFWLLFRKWRPAFVNKAPDVLTRRRYKEDGANIWITRDKEIRQNVIDDPLSSVNMSINFHHYMSRGIYNTWKKKNTTNIKKDVPIGIFCGSADLIGGFGDFATKLKDKYKKLGIQKVELQLYKDSRHEVINDLEYEKVIADVICFFNDCI